MTEFSVVGKRLPRIDAIQKVTGSARYTTDITLPGLLFGKILRSPLAHAKIIRIDVSKAEKIPGVIAVITARDTPKIKYVHVGPPFQDKFVLAVDKVRYVGDEVAAVAAETPDVAEEALRFIEVVYEELPAVFDPEKAMEQSAPKIHGENNVAMKGLRNYGEVERAFEESDYVFEDRFSTQAVAHCCMEPHGSVALFDLNGNLTIWTPTQSPYFVQKELAVVLDMPVSKVRVMEVPVGGGFGARSKICEDEAICALLSRKTGRPVKITLTRDEEFTTTRTRHPMIITLRTGVKKDGTLAVRHVKMVVDNGAYNHMGPAVMGYAALAATSHYRVPCVRVETYLVYTNKQFGGPFRGYGSPQVTFAIESQMDMIADRLGMDKLDFRLKNCHHAGETTVSGWKITSDGLRECLIKAAEEIGWKKRKANPEKNRGIGIAGMIHVSGAKVYDDGDFSSAYLNLYEDGTATVFTGTTDIGQGSSTVLAMIAAEELGISLDEIRIVSMDTSLTPIDLGSWASRITFVAGNSIRLAAQDVKRQLFEAIAKKFECNPLDLRMTDKKIWVTGSPTKCIPVGEAILENPHRVGKMLIGKGFYDPPSEKINRQTGVANISAAYGFAAQSVEVRVDPLTGKVKVLRVIAAHDAGRAINPDLVEGQIEGAIAQGLGYALMEKVVCGNDGKVKNANYLDYKIPFSTDMPEIRTFIIETQDPEGPFGAKGIGEPGLIPTAPAIANAIFDAVRTRFYDLPITQEELLEELGSKKRGSC
jgi:4-hydroxybenzoyl-CoA reductase alpha subunit